MITKERGNFTGYDGGFPLDCETLEMLQGQIELLEKLSAGIGDKVILSGCGLVLGGIMRSSGYVVIGGEVLYFKGGDASAGVKVVTERIDVESNGEMYGGAYVRKYLAPVGAGETAQYLWSEIETLTSIPALRAELVGRVDDLGVELRDMDEDWRSGDTALNGEISELNGEIEELSGEIEELRRIIDGASSAGVVEPVGTIKPWAGADTPGGGTWLECSSTQYDLPYRKSDYPELFGVLADEYKTTQDKVLNGEVEDIVSEFSFRVPNIQGDDVKYFIKAKL